MSSPAAARPQRTFLGHPVGLYVLFFTEMWERFSYYGMRALLMLYMVNYFKWAQPYPSTIYKIYTTMVYVTPILGGYLADRFLGNKRAVIIGAILMAIGHFLMAFENFTIFYSALIFLIIGNGFFKPNMSTQVGRLYPANDPRLDGAYTIFYMGINLGALLTPLVCGWLADNTMGSYHSGFTAAGIGMCLGLLIYVLGQPFVNEIASGPKKAEHPGVPHKETVTSAPIEQMTVNAGHPEVALLPGASGHIRALTEDEAARQSSALGALSRYVPHFLVVLGVACLIATPILLMKSLKTAKSEELVSEIFDAITLAVLGGSLLLMGWIASTVRMGLRDRVFAIPILGIFVVFFWAAGEQAGNVLNVWADKNTNRYLTGDPKQVDPIPEAEPQKKKEGDGEKTTGVVTDRLLNMFKLKSRPEEKKTWLDRTFNPISTASFQSINPTAIVVFAPLFAWFWIWLDRRGWQPSIPMKMTFGLILVTASMAVMEFAAKKENQSTTVVMSGGENLKYELVDGNKFAFKNPKSGEINPVRAGRLLYDPKTHTFTVYGVLSDNDRDHMVAATAPESFTKKIEELQKASEKIGEGDIKEVSVKLDDIPEGFDQRYMKELVSWNAETRTLTTTRKLEDKEMVALKDAAGNPGFRSAMNELMIKSDAFKVSSWWLFWNYILVTWGELCLSPVGLSMVSKLAPARWATLLMGMWMLTSAFGNFAAGLLGEKYDTVSPTEFFLYATIGVAVGAVVLFLISSLVVKIMHGVK